MSYLRDAARYYRAEPHQDAALDSLWDKLTPEEQEAFKKSYRNKPQNAGAGLNVPYFLQLDNASGQGYRECFSSSCAMLAAFHGKLKSDDEYNGIRRKYGDTTSLTAHLNALTSLGLKPAFSTKGTPDDLEKEVVSGYPVAVGWLHQGPRNKPSGGGHWSVIVGFTKTHFIHNDPYGEADMVNGGYINHTKGKGISYSRGNWVPRWCIEGPGSGWYLTCRG